MDPIAQALLSGQAAQAPQMDITDPVVRAMLGLGPQHGLPDDPTALAAMSGQAAGAQFPDMQEFARIRDEANRMMTPVQQQPEPQGQTWSDWANDPSFNDGRGRYGLVPNLVRLGGRAYDALPEMQSIPGAQYVSRSLEALGRAPGDIVEMGPLGVMQGAWETTEAMGPTGVISPVARALMSAYREPMATAAAAGSRKAAGKIDDAVRASDTRIMRAPPHTLQQRWPDGKFMPFDKKTRSLRDKAIEERAWRREWRKGEPERRAAEAARVEKRRELSGWYGEERRLAAERALKKD